MVALLRHQPAPHRSFDAPRRGHLRLVEGGGEGAGRPGYRLRPDPATGRVVGVSHQVEGFAGLPVAALVAVAVAIFGGLLLVRVAQGGPSSADGGVERSVPPLDPAAVAGAPAPVDEAAGDIRVLVAPGDSLWSIVEEVAPGRDPRPLVVALAEANGGASLQIGQQIVIPGQLLD
jgi:hypothetical protein